MASRPRREAGAGAGWVPVAVVAVVILAALVLVYPIHGYRVAIGLDTPVYTWWSRFAGAAGLGGLQTGARPGIVALPAALAGVLRQPVAAIVAALGPVFVVACALGVGAWIWLALGADRLRFVLAGVLTAAFLSILLDGYLSTLAFGSGLIAAMAVLGHALATAARGRIAWGPALLAGGLLGAAGLFHPQLLPLGAVVVAGGAAGLAWAWRRPADRPAGALRAAALTIGLAAIVALALVGAGLLLSRGPDLGLVDTSRDSVLRRFGLGAALRASYVSSLRSAFPWWRAALMLGLAATSVPALLRMRRPATPGREDGNGEVEVDPAALPGRALFLGAMAAWLLVSAGGVVLLLAGTSAPGQRLAAFCVPLPALAAIGLSDLASRGVAIGSRRVSGVVVAAALGVVFVVAVYPTWLLTHPRISPQALTQMAAAGREIGSQPANRALVLVMDDRSAHPALLVTRYENYLRSVVPPLRVPAVHVFLGSPAGYLDGLPGADGLPEHDRLARESLAGIRALHGPPPLAVVLQAIDPAGYRSASSISGSRVLAPGVIALPPGLGGGRGPDGSGWTEAGPGPMSPWTVVWLGAVVLGIAGAVGAGWSVVAVRADGVVPVAALAPGFGMAAVAVAGVGIDAAGVRLADAGGFVAIGVALVLGVVAAATVRRGEAGSSATRAPARRPSPAHATPS
ncbi:MAG TPA: hypothetical protein VGH10_08810 [Actinomycetota bacterium]